MIYKLNWNKYNWRKFEKICYEYIKNIYSAKFYKVKLTKARKDSGRDIIITNHEGTFEAWGECKDHKRNIDLSVIGKNVVLALSHQINKAIFFSVTSITPNTKIEILNVAQKNGFDVLFLDGNELNTEILNCEKVSKKYFRKEYEEYIRKNNSNVWIDTLVSEFPFAEDAKNNGKRQYHLQNSFQIFLHLFIKNVKNEDISDINVKLINIPETDAIFYETEHKWERTLKAHSDLLCTFCGMVFSPKKNIEMPQVIIKYTFSTGEPYEENISVGTVDASDIWKAPYVNSDSRIFYTEAIKLLGEVVPEKYAKVLYLYGKSGMGKSRLMSEIENKAYEYSYRVIHIDFREKEEISAMQSFIIALLGIPLSKSKPFLEYSSFEKIYNNKLALNDIKLLHEFIYFSNNNLSLNTLTNSIINLLVNESAEDNILLSIDNIQEMSHDLQITFWNILEHCIKISIPVLFIFTQNTERKIENQNVLVQYLISHGENRENYVLDYHCDILKENDAVTLMQELLHLQSESDEFIRTLLKKIELCPMDILLLAKSLDQMPGLFQTIDNHKYIVNTNSFSLDKYEIPKTFDTVIKLRISNLLNSTHKPDKYNQLFSLLSFFDGILTMKIFEKCAFSMDMLSLANKNIILKVNHVENTIHFYHEKIYQYIKKEYVGLPTNIIDIICTFYEQMENKSFGDYYFYLKILIAKGQNGYAVNLGLTLLDQYKDSSQSKYIIKTCDLLQQIIDSGKNPAEYFKVIFLKADFLLERINISEAENLFEEAKELIINKNTLFDPQVVTHFFHRYINQKLHSLQYEKAFNAIEELKEKVEATANSSMIINDRLCVALYSLGREKEALKAIDSVIQIAKKEKDTIWLSIAYSDKAFCHYYNSKNIDEICSDFSEAVDYYENGKKYTDLSRKIEKQNQKTIINILKKDFKNAEKEIQQSIRIGEEANYGYLLVPSYNIQSYIMIVNKQMNSAQALLKKSLEYANTFSNSKALISIYNNLGTMYIAMGEYQEAYSRYLVGFEILKKICKPQNSFRYMGLLSNIVKLSIFLEKSETLSKIIDNYASDILKRYQDKCQKAYDAKENLTPFSYGVLSFDGYDYLY